MYRTVRRLSKPDCQSIKRAIKLRRYFHSVICRYRFQILSHFLALLLAEWLVQYGHDKHRPYSVGFAY